MSACHVISAVPLGSKPLGLERVDLCVAEEQTKCVCGWSDVC